MIAWLNFAVLVAATFLTLIFYVKSVGPVALARRIGERAWHRCELYRRAAIITMSITVLNYVVMLFYPLPLPIPRHFPWPWPLSIAIGLLILTPALYLLIRGSKDAGEETLKPRPGHGMYGGIYEKMRHPQAVGESVTWLAGAFLLHSPFLAAYSLIWLPIYYVMCLAEERDLVLRFGQEYVDYRRRVGFFGPKRGTPTTDRDAQGGKDVAN
ncbi:MAG: isoprenylcysteine carboxylmethyltransferase family protein [Caldilineae bacterium]|nr:MAG: isoprenylcysteine carboxylmethyltransferase family protein [Caldilineae bacterium]